MTPKQSLFLARILPKQTCNQKLLPLTNVLTDKNRIIKHEICIQSYPAIHNEKDHNIAYFRNFAAISKQNM